MILNGETKKLLKDNQPFAYNLIQINRIYDPVDTIFKNNTCPYCKNGLNYADCRNMANLRATFFRFCHGCKKIYFMNQNIVMDVRAYKLLNSR